MRCAGSSSPTCPTGRSPATDTLRLGGRTIVIIASRRRRTRAGDLLVWLPRERVLFAGDILIEDGVTMVVDGSARALLRGAGPASTACSREWPCRGTAPSRRDPAALVARTRELHHRPCEPTCARRSSTACRCSARSTRCRRRREPSGVAQLPPAAERGAGLCGGGASRTWDWRLVAMRRALGWRGRLRGCCSSVRRTPAGERSRRGAAPSGVGLPTLVSTERARALAGGGPGVPARRADRRLRLPQGPSAGRRVPQQRDAARQRRRHPDAAALGAGVSRAVLPARASTSTSRW